MKAAQSKVEEKFCFYRKNYRPLWRCGGIFLNGATFSD
jgi:hypothetical protein